MMERFKDLMDYGFTASMEESLDSVAQGERDWRQVLDDFYADFSKQLQQAQSKEKGMRTNDPTDTDILCSNCGRHMQIRTASTGVFQIGRASCRERGERMGDEEGLQREGL